MEIERALDALHGADHDPRLRGRRGVRVDHDVHGGLVGQRGLKSGGDDEARGIAIAREVTRQAGAGGQADDVDLYRARVIEGAQKRDARRGGMVEVLDIQWHGRGSRVREDGPENEDEDDRKDQCEEESDRIADVALCEHDEVGPDPICVHVASPSGAMSEGRVVGSAHEPNEDVLERVLRGAEAGAGVPRKPRPS